ncbi:MAG: sulfatase-like hydrolase/transferase [Planctomycetes bacterium]|nr:sulfatase-like hydrolase/transferase [Planctomycetota bacterium]
MNQLTTTAALGLAVFLLSANAAQAAPSRPNFGFIIADDCTYHDLGCYGGQAHTPNIDRLAGEGMRFTHCFQAAPMCSPTRHNIYTGLYPVKSGAYPNHTFAKRGTINGSDHFGIRSVRSRRYKYILNLSPEITYTNACTKSKTFLSWKSKAESDPHAADKVRRYQHRPAEELFDTQSDRFEWTNLADDPKYAKIKADLKSQLTTWMKSQGDLGKQTELQAREHQGRGKKRNRKKKRPRTTN